MSPVKKNSKARRIFQEVVEQVADIYIYLLIFYAACSLLGCFFDRWETFFNWPAFHASVIVLGILSLFSVKGKKFIQAKKKTAKHLWPGWRKAFGQQAAVKEIFRGLKGVGLKFNKANLRKLLIVFKNFIFLLLKLVNEKVKKFQKKDFLKIAFILFILVGSLFKGIGPVSFLILGYGLATVLFGLPLVLTAFLTGLFFIFCPILTIAKKEAWTGLAAVYAYYFLIIVVATQLREYCRKERPKKVIHS